MATQGSGSIAHMGTLVSRRRQGGSLGYTAPIRIHRQGTRLHSGPERPDRRPLAAEWMRRREAELDPLRAHGEPRGKGRPSPGCWSGTGRRSRRSAIAARSACCPKLGTSSTDSQGCDRRYGRHADLRSARVPLQPQAGGRQRYPYRQAPCPPALRFHELHHEATSRLFERGYDIPESPNSPCMSPGDLEAVHPSPARARAGAARRESLTGAGCRRSGPKTQAV